MDTTRHGLSRHAIVGAAFAATLGCGGGGARQTYEQTTVERTPPVATPAHARGDAEARATVGRRGGTLELQNGGRLEIPEGALSEEIEVTLRNGSPARQVWTDAENERALGPTLEIEPPLHAAEGTAFRISSPSLPIPAPFQAEHLALGHEEEADRGRAMEMGGTVTRWEFWPARVEANRFVAEVPALGGHRLQFGLSR